MPHLSCNLFTQDEAVISYALTYSYIVFAFTTPITVGIAMEKGLPGRGTDGDHHDHHALRMYYQYYPGSDLHLWSRPGARNGHCRSCLGYRASGRSSRWCLYFIDLSQKAIPPLRLRMRKGHVFDPDSLCGRIYGVGIPAALNMALPSLMITALNGILASFSAVYVLVLGIYYKLQTFIYLTANGIVQGIRPIVGYNYGAGEYKRVKKVFQTALVLTAGVMLAGTIHGTIFASWLMGLFTSNLETISAGCTALRIISIGFLVSSISVTAS